MGTRTGPRYRMEWQGNLAKMLKHGTLVIEVCPVPCKFHIDIDVWGKVAELGPDGDLWDRRGECPLCGKRTHFMCSPGPGTVFRPMLTQP